MSSYSLVYRSYLALLLFALCHCDNDNKFAEDINFLLVEDPPKSGHYVWQDLSAAPNTSILVNDDVVLLYLYTREYNGTRITRYNVSRVNFDISKETVVVIHGWMSTLNDSMAQSVKDAYLQSRDVNVIVVDWSDTAIRNYVTAKFYNPNVAKVISDCLQYMVDTINLDLNKTVLVGHSMGAHIAGIVGSNLNGSVNHLVGLDPAGPLYFVSRSRDKLDPSDAQFVEVIHTCAGGLGYPLDLGDSDYWPNGGRLPQPGCGLDITGSCSHSRSYEYYSESLISGGFRSVSCNSQLFYVLTLCRSPVAYMGEDPLDRSKGNFYLSTNSQPPYSKS